MNQNKVYNFKHEFHGTGDDDYLVKEILSDGRIRTVDRNHKNYVEWSANNTPAKIAYSPTPYADDLSAAKTKRINQLKTFVRNELRIFYDYAVVRKTDPNDGAEIPEALKNYKISMLEKYTAAKNEVNNMTSVESVANHADPVWPNSPD